MPVDDQSHSANGRGRLSDDQREAARRASEWLNKRMDEKYPIVAVRKVQKLLHAFGTVCATIHVYSAKDIEEVADMLNETIAEAPPEMKGSFIVRNAPHQDKAFKKMVELRKVLAKLEAPIQ